MAVTQVYYEVLCGVEEDGLLDISNIFHMFCIHYVFLPQLKDGFGRDNLLLISKLCFSLSTGLCAWPVNHCKTVGTVRGLVEASIFVLELDCPNLIK